MDKVVKDEGERANVKAYLKSIYKPIRECYKYYAGIGPSNGVFSIGQNSFQEIANKTEMVDNENLKLSDMDLEFISTNAGIKNKPLNPDRQLVRYQLMEIFSRLGIQKYFKSKTTDHISEAIKMLFD